MADQIPVRRTTEPEKLDMALSLLVKLVNDTDAIRRILEKQSGFHPITWVGDSFDGKQ